jgi:Sulfotransferase domain
VRSKPRLPNFLIVGAMRSGTTSLARYLGDHPDIFMATVKEIEFFDLNFDKGLDWYAAHFTHANGKQAWGEATQTYMYEPTARERMARTLPRALLIAILRDPVDRAYSHYWHNRARKRESLEFGDALAAEPMRLRSADLNTRLRFSYADRSRYLGQLRALATLYPRERIMVLLFERLRADPLSSYADACRFLGVNPRFAPGNLGSAINRYGEFRSTAVRDAAKHLPRRVKHAIARVNRVEASYPPIDVSVRSELADSFAGEKEELSNWLGLDLSVWLS